jgi:phage terminase large subunit-like protein
MFDISELEGIPAEKFEELGGMEQAVLFQKLMGALAEKGMDNSAGFATFYGLVFGRQVPDHAMEWVEGIYEGRAYKKGAVIEAFRGSTKTTTITIAFAAFRIGLEPHNSNLLIQVGDDIATDNSSQVADIIEHNPGWKLVFPHVVPDKEKGWGAGGYEVKRTDMDYGEWRKLRTETSKDPTLIGLGYKSRAIIGKHPTGVLLVDDINDENNTRSQRELAGVLKILLGTIFPTITPTTWVIFTGTPWTRDDVLAYVKATGQFKKLFTPVMEGERLAWPEMFSWEEIERQRKLAGELEFARMFLLDLSAAEGVNLRREWLHEYPYEKIGEDWGVVMGVDYASTQDKIRDQKRDYFALAVGRIIPGGGVVLVDGLREQLSQGEATNRVRAIAMQYPTLSMIGVENVGKGEEFFSLLRTTTNLPVMPFHASKSKGKRFEKEMAPAFQFSRAWISDAITPFVKDFITEWIRWPDGEHDDTLDAVYYMMRTAIGHLMPQPETGEIRTTNPLYDKPAVPEGEEEITRVRVWEKINEYERCCRSCIGNGGA